MEFRKESILVPNFVCMIQDVQWARRHSGLNSQREWLVSNIQHSVIEVLLGWWGVSHSYN